MLKPLKPPEADPALFTTREKIVLLNGSKLNGCKFKPWDKDPPLSDFHGDLFEDDTEFHFSAEQMKLFEGWKRPSDGDDGMEKHEANEVVDLVQDMATDCSVVASLCAVTARTETFGRDSSIISGVKFPAQGHPMNGKYVFKFNFNGCNRKVEIDDRLPASRTRRALHVFDRKNLRTIWPALIEKAYLKVRGGYDFPGSNSGTDLWVLTGWIPEQLFLRSEELVPNALWKRVMNAFKYGDVLITIGTGKLSTREERSLGLAGEHAYAIIGMKEEGSSRMFLIKNPWSHGGIWTGSRQQDTLPPNEDDGGLTSDHITPGTFWMDLNSVFQNFVTIYLNWNPGLFRHRRDVHFAWDLASRSPPESFSNNPQYLLRTRKGGSVWLLLSKHFESFSRDAMRANEHDSRLQMGFLSLYAFEEQFRVSLASGSLLRAPYVDAPNILLRFEAPDDASYIIVPAEQDLSGGKHSFTISAFSTNPLVDFKVAEQRYPHSVIQKSAWTMNSSGGNTSSPRFHTNPQFHLNVQHVTDLYFLLETQDSEVAVQLKLVWAGGKRISHTIAKRDVYGDSGEYRRGSTAAVISAVIPGDYTVVCSTFQAGQLGDFVLRVWSMSPCTLRPIPSITEPGRFATTITPTVFPYGVQRILAPVFVARLTRFHSLVQSLPAQKGIPRASPLKLSLEFGQGSNKFVLASTEEFVERIARLPERDLKPEMCKDGAPGVWLVVERLCGGGDGPEEQIHLEVFGSEKEVSIGAWGMASEEPIEAFRERMQIRN